MNSNKFRDKFKPFHQREPKANPTYSNAEYNRKEEGYEYNSDSHSDSHVQAERSSYSPTSLNIDEEDKDNTVMQTHRPRTSTTEVNNNISPSSTQDDVNEIDNTIEGNNLSQLPQEEINEKLNSYILRCTSLESQAKETNEKYDKLYATFLAEKAENINLTKRHQRQIEEGAKYAVSNFSKDMVEILENLYRACDSFNTLNLEEVTPATKEILNGVNMTLDILKTTLKKHGVERLWPQDELFNSAHHEAISQVSTDKPDGTVVEVISAGYIIHERLLKPALVVVSKN